jgi:mRNA interferase MazF
VVPYDNADALEAGDVLWVEFGPPLGHEQAGRRPALVVSPTSYNERSSLILVCPITRNIAPWGFKVEIKGQGRIHGVVLADQIKSIDRHVRFVRKVERVDSDTVDRVHGMIASLLEIRVSN